MKNYTQKWKKLNRNGIKLSLICGLNWLIGFVAKSQFYLFSVSFLGLLLLTDYIPQDYRVVTVTMVEILAMSKVIFNLGYGMWLQDLRRIKLSLSDVILLLAFVKVINYASHYTISKQMIINLYKFWIISAVFAILVKVLLPKLFEHYLFKKVINKEYLGIRKTTEPLPPQSNLYVDADEHDVNKRMTTINQNVIKQPYQDIVELSFLNRKVTTGIHYKKTVLVTKETERTFEDVDTIYYPVFKVYPFGIEKDFGYTLTQLKLSRKAALREARYGRLEEKAKAMALDIAKPNYTERVIAEFKYSDDQIFEDLKLEKKRKWDNPLVSLQEWKGTKAKLIDIANNFLSRNYSLTLDCDIALMEEYGIVGCNPFHLDPLTGNFINQAIYLDQCLVACAVRLNNLDYIKPVFYHELVHYALSQKDGMEFRDGQKGFENELLRLGIPTSIERWTKDYKGITIYFGLRDDKKKVLKLIERKTFN